ncbi:MAG TPA: S41 family peptidase [bacterium]|nr:S41 family peptidase [bacterium]
MKKKAFLTAVLIVIPAVCFAFLFGGGGGKADEYEALKPLMEVYSILKNNYVDEEKVVPSELTESAIKGMVSHVDPFSQYLDPQRYKDMNEDTKAEFGGLGIEIAVKDGQLMVVAPIEDTPAYEAGIKAGDKIMTIEGESTEGIEVLDAVHKLRGTPGTKVTIQIQRGIEQRLRDFTITRAVIKIRTVRYSVLEDGTGYLRINEFMGDAAGAVDRALKSLAKSKAERLIIDLRNNPGGLLDQAVRVAEFFLPKDRLIVYTEGRAKTKGMEFKSSRNMDFKGDIAVLINRGSASASEILSGALQDHNRAVIIGTQSFGKGSVQTIIPLSGGSALRLTTAQYMTPSGRKIHGVGIKPDIILEEPIPTAYTSNLFDKGYFEGFAGEFLKKNPDGLVSLAQKESVKVSETDVKVLFKKTPENALLDEFRKFLRKKEIEILDHEMAADRETILRWLKSEIAKKHKGREEERKVSVENDVQIRRAVDFLNALAKLKAGA